MNYNHVFIALATLLISGQTYTMGFLRTKAAKKAILQEYIFLANKISKYGQTMDKLIRNDKNLKSRLDMMVQNGTSSTYSFYLPFYLDIFSRIPNNKERANYFAKGIEKYKKINRKKQLDSLTNYNNCWKTETLYNKKQNIDGDENFDEKRTIQEYHNFTQQKLSKLNLQQNQYTRSGTSDEN